MNIIPILEGKKRIILYTPLVGNVELVRAKDGKITTKSNNGLYYFFNNEGCLRLSCCNINAIYSDECLLFPAFDQRDWEKYAQGAGELGHKYFYVDIMRSGLATLFLATNRENDIDLIRFANGNYFMTMREGEQFVKEINRRFKNRT